MGKTDFDDEYMIGTCTRKPLYKLDKDSRVFEENKHIFPGEEELEKQEQKIIEVQWDDHKKNSGINKLDTKERIRTSQIEVVLKIKN